MSRARRLTLRSSRRVPAGRFRPSFHSRPYAPRLHARLNSNVSAQYRPQFKRSSPPCKVGESMLTPGVLRRLRRYASSHDAAFGVGRLRRSAASHRKAAEAARGGNYRIDAVCPFIGIRCAWLLHREGRAQPQAKTHEEGSGPALQRVHCNHVLRRSSLPLTRVALCPRQRTAR